MFFMMAITDGRKDLKFSQMIICDVCGKYGRYQVFMTYTVLSLFFIPCFKWNRRYYVQTSCCNTIYELDPGGGKGHCPWGTGGDTAWAVDEDWIREWRTDV